MKIPEFNQRRIKLNKQLTELDVFFKDFGGLDDKVYEEGAIPKKYKELTGLSLSVYARCNDCILFHLQNCVIENISVAEIVEAIKMGVMAGGSITYPNARYAMEAIQELKIK